MDVKEVTIPTHWEAHATQDEEPPAPWGELPRFLFHGSRALEGFQGGLACWTLSHLAVDLRKQEPPQKYPSRHPPTRRPRPVRRGVLGLAPSPWPPPTTSVLVILARSSTRASPVSELTSSSCCSPQMAAPTLPVAIIDGGYMANLKSAERRGGRAQGPARSRGPSAPQLKVPRHRRASDPDPMPSLSCVFPSRLAFFLCLHQRCGYRFKPRGLREAECPQRRHRGLGAPRSPREGAPALVGQDEADTVPYGDDGRSRTGRLRPVQRA